MTETAKLYASEASINVINDEHINLETLGVAFELTSPPKNEINKNHFEMAKETL